MSIRVRKYLGYGITDLEGREDPRVNWASPLLQLPGIPGSGYYGWLESRRQETAGRVRMSADWAYLRQVPAAWQENLDECVGYQPEYGLPEVLVVRPFSCADWFRSDNIIDYMTETFPRDGECFKQESYVQVYEHGIYPFSASYMDKGTGEQLPSEVMEWVRAWSDKDQLGRALARACLDTAAAEYTPFADHDAAAGNIVPDVPREIRDLAMFGELFTADSVVLQLRPLLYTCWS